eukprot:TRINITY_DN21193_c0_g1_i1.p1 TRINITY_DN21193_c0_g1~~TRINITY_DN21193_c0_g1_i1.p1  ORF type:complete len:106 (-),score=4.60 TRINITY_DN21193_c0_g1_i1:101-418(-)
MCLHVSIVTQAMMAHTPHLQRAPRRTSGTTLDKVSERILMCRRTSGQSLVYVHQNGRAAARYASKDHIADYYQAAAALSDNEGNSNSSEASDSDVDAFSDEDLEN